MSDGRRTLDVTTTVPEPDMMPDVGSDVPRDLEADFSSTGLDGFDPNSGFD